MNITFFDTYCNYLKYIDNRQKYQTKRTLKDRFENKILPYFKDYNIYEINNNIYVEWQMLIDSNNYSNSYRMNLHYLMVGFFDYCVKYYKLEKNVARDVGQFKRKNEKRQYHVYNKRDFKKFIKGFDDDVYKLFFKTLFLSGIRPGEAMALKFSDLSNCCLSINKTIAEHPDKETGIRFIDTPKSYSSYRDILIPKKLYKALLELEKKYNKVDTNKNYDYFVFGGLKPLAPTTINRYKLKACQKAHIRPIKLHEFRHSHATLLLNRRILINEISKRLGHSDIAMTLNTYTHTDETQEKRVVRTLNSLRLSKY